MNRNFLDYPTVPKELLDYSDSNSSLKTPNKNNLSIIYSTVEKTFNPFYDGLDAVYITDETEVMRKSLDKVDIDAVLLCKKVYEYRYSEVRQILYILFLEAGSRGESLEVELKWLLLSSINHCIEVGKKLLPLLKTNYSSVKREKKFEKPDFGTHTKAIHNLIMYLLDFRTLEKYIAYEPGCDLDDTGGSSYWDGKDFLAWGLEKILWKKGVDVHNLKPSEYQDAGNITISPQAKFRDYQKIIIPVDIFNAYKNNISTGLSYGREQEGVGVIKDRNEKAVYSDKYNVPAKVFTDATNWKLNDSVFVFENNNTKKTPSIIATGSVKRTIFWMELPTSSITDKFEEKPGRKKPRKTAPMDVFGN